MKPREEKKKINEFGPLKEFEEIGALFNQGSIERLSRLEELKPTKMHQVLQMGYNTYGDKIRNPERLTIEEVVKLARIVGTDYSKIMEVIFMEIRSKYKI